MAWDEDMLSIVFECVIPLPHFIRHLPSAAHADSGASLPTTRKPADAENGSIGQTLKALAS
jgi:hypothetical protein